MTTKVISFVIAVIILSTSCRSDFELLRTSGDSAKMYEAANKFFAEKEYTKAITLYEMVIPSYRGKAEAEEISYKFAHAHYLNRSYVLSSHYFKSFADTYTTSTRKEEALHLSAISYYKLSPRYNLDQTDSQKAIDAFQLFINTYPDSELIDECNEYIDQLRLKMEMKEFESGKLYYNTRSYSSAIQSLENMLKDYPDSNRSEEARYIIAKASLDWANNSIYTKKEERYKKTVERCNSYLKKHPSSSRLQEITEFKTKSQQELNNIQNG